ncbi:MAG: TonB-dependent receptor [Bacteroidota bacterium]
MKSFRLVWCLFFLFLIQPIKAQKSGSISGFVKNGKTGEVLSGASVIVENSEVGAITNEDGFFFISKIPIGTYNLQANYLGYSTSNIFNVVVRSTNNPPIEFNLTPSTYEIEEVEITINPFEVSEVSPLSIQKLSQEEIVSYPGGNNDVTKVVQSLPGIGGSVGGFRNDIIIRGGAPSENVYYLDGIEIPNLNHFATQGSAGGPVGLVNVAFLDNVQLTSSAFGANYDNVLSGVLQFDQRNGNNQQAAGNFRLSSSEVGLTLEGPLFKAKKEYSKTTYIVSARRSYLQFIFEVLGIPILPDYWDYQYKINHEIDEYNSIYVTGIGSIDDFQVNELEELDPEQQAIQDQVPIIKQRTNTVGVSWKKRFKDNSGFMLMSLSNNVLFNDFKQYTDNIRLEGLAFQNDSREMESRFRFNLKRYKERWTVDYGISLIYAGYNNQTINIQNNLQFDTNLSFLRYGAFFQANSSLLEGRLSLALGMRTDGNTFTENGNEIYRTLSPRLSAAYQLSTNGKWSISASLGRYFKILPYTALGFQDNTATFVNQNSSYIRADHMVAGLNYLLNEKARFSIEGFYKNYTDYPISIIDQVSLANKGEGNEVFGSEAVTSNGKGQAYGVELLFQQKFTGKFYGLTSLTLYRSLFSGNDSESFFPAIWDNRILLSLLGGYKFWKSWEINSRVRLLGGAPFAPIDQNTSLGSYPILIRDYSLLGEERLGVFSTVDIRLDKKWSFKSWALDVFVEFQNVLGATAPIEPQFGLARNEEGIINSPRELVEIPNTLGGEPLPALGVVVNF